MDPNPPTPPMSVSELRLVFPDGRLYALDSPRFQSLLIRLDGLLLRAENTEAIHLPAHDHASHPAVSASPSPTTEPIWSAHVRIDPASQPLRNPLWKATFRGPRSAVAEQMSAAILTQLRDRCHLP